MPILSRRFGLWKTIDDETGEAKSVVRIWNEQGQLSGKVEKIFSKPGKKCEKGGTMRIRVLLIGIILLSGCAGRGWVQEGKSARAIEQDSFVCEDAALKGGADLSGKEIQARADKCMEDKGYQKR